jgi:hypothetical protein
VKDGERVGGLYVIEGMPPELLVNSRTQNNRLRLIVWRLRFGSAEWGSVFPKPRLLRDRRAAPGGTKEAVGNIILV